MRYFNQLTDSGVGTIDGRMVCLWRAVYAEGEVLDVLVQSKRNKHAALKLMRKLLKKHAFVPERLVLLLALAIAHASMRRWALRRAA
jgi:transposase-like protein